MEGQHEQRGKEVGREADVARLADSGSRAHDGVLGDRDSNVLAVGEMLRADLQARSGFRRTQRSRR